MSPEVGPFRGTAEEWDAFVSGRGEATFCHLFGWKHVLRDALRRDLEMLEARAGGELLAVMPLARVRGPLGDYLVSVPYLNYGGPVGLPEGARALVVYAAERARRASVKLMELRGRDRSWLPDDPGDLGEGLRVSDRRLTVILDLPAEADQLWDAFRSKVRSQVRRPMKEDMVARFGPETLADFYGVFVRNMRDLGTPALPARFFRAILRAFPAQAAIGAVYHEGRPAAAGFGFLWNGEFEMTWASSLRGLNNLSPNMLLYWEFMRLAMERGASRFNFGRCPPGSGTHRFKRQWGGRDEELPWLQWSAGTAVGTPSPDSGRLQLATRLWSRLPVPIARALGPLIARTIP